MSTRHSRAKKQPESDKRVVSPGRIAAGEILRRVEEESAFAAPLLASFAEDLAPDDRALSHELVLGVLRRRLWLDSLIEHFSGRGIETLDPPVRTSLRLGLYQLRFLTRVPARAAVNESVNLIYSARLRSAAPFVNAILRRAARELDFDPVAEISDPFERVAVESSHPVWLIKRWADSLGLEQARLLAQANNEPAPTSFRINEAKTSSDAILGDLRARDIDVSASTVVSGGFRLARGLASAPYLRELAAEGSIYFQDEASQLVARVLGAEKNERILDVCAAPGGKTTQLAWLARDAAQVIAGDLHHHRLRLVGEACARLGVKSVIAVRLNACDRLPFAEETFDRVLLDAPCSGTGTLRHNPEIRWQLTNEDISELASKQANMLRAAARSLRKGGRLVYSTCSLEREENEDVIAGFLELHQDFHQVTAVPAPSELVERSGAARTWPHRTDTDGFFVAALEKR